MFMIEIAEIYLGILKKNQKKVCFIKSI